MFVRSRYYNCEVCLKKEPQKKEKNVELRKPSSHEMTRIAYNLDCHRGDFEIELDPDLYFVTIRPQICYTETQTFFSDLKMWNVFDTLPAVLEFWFQFTFDTLTLKDDGEEEHSETKCAIHINTREQYAFKIRQGLRSAFGTALFCINGLVIFPYAVL